MLYKTIVLELLQQRPQIYDQLLANRTLLPTLNLFASQFRDCHQAWMNSLSQARPDIDPIQIASEAGEMALHELEASLPSTLPEDKNEIFSIEAAMAFIRAHTPPA
jgi:hypothetical protein